MFDDIFDRNWELALLIHEQYKTAAEAEHVTPEGERRFRVRSRRINELLDRVVRELPNWNEQPDIRSIPVN